jgi:uncharacterized protein
MAQSNVQGSVMKIFPTLTLAVVSLTLTAYAAQSIDCKKAALGPSEQIVCNSPSLLKVDSQMMADLDILMQYSTGVQSRRPDQESKWLQAFAAKRDWCGRDTACIQSAYKTQMDPMERTIAQKRLDQGIR